MRPQQRGDRLVSPLLGPGERRRPRLVIRERDRRATRQQEFDRRRSIGSRGPGERRRSILVVASRNGGARVEQNGGAVGSVLRGRVVQQRLVLPVHLVGAHAVREQRAKGVRSIQIPLTGGVHRWHAKAGG